jgi:Arc/MetJ-type ribon-helix-helix transcriptional regulator
MERADEVDVGIDRRISSGVYDDLSEAIPYGVNAVAVIGSHTHRA